MSINEDLIPAASLARRRLFQYYSTEPEARDIGWIAIYQENDRKRKANREQQT